MSEFQFLAAYLRKPGTAELVGPITLDEALSPHCTHQWGDWTKVASDRGGVYMRQCLTDPCLAWQETRNVEHTR